MLKDKVRELYLKGYSSSEIANILGKKSSTIRSCINRNLNDFKQVNKEQKKIKNKVIAIKDLYLKGYNAKEIAKLLDKSHSLVRKYISEELLKDYGFEHRKARDLNKSIIKSIDRMNNSYISNKSFLNQNRQSYDYDKNYNLVFNENRGTRTEDVPEKFLKEII